MKKTIVLTLILALLLAGCSGAGAPVSETTEPTVTATTAPAVIETVPEVIETEPAEEPAPELPADFAPDFTFTTTDRDGNEWTQDCFSANRLTVLNFWEPWCGPCVGELPDLEQISLDYADQGVLILGIYETDDMEDEVQEILDTVQITYPILHYSSEFDFLQTGYVPTTVVVDQTGKIVVEPFAGSQEYSKWSEMLGELLK